MMAGMRESAYLAIMLFAIGCGGTDPGAGGGGDDQQTPMDAPSANADAYVPPDGYTKLIGRSWTLQPGQTDIYRCVRVTIPSDMYITDIQAQAPLGTHHTVLSIAGANGTSGPDGEQDCSVQTLGTVMLYASGVGTSPLHFPSGVGIKVAAGTQLHLNLHLYNAGDDPLNAESAIWVKSQSTPTPTLAEMGYPGIGTVQWFALLTVAGVPDEVITVLHKAAVEAVNSKDVQEAFRKQGITSTPSQSPADAKAWVASEYEHWRKMFAEVPIQIDN